jgi:hypothetical protein
MILLLIISFGLLFIGIVALVCFGLYQKGWANGFDESSAIYKNAATAASESVDKALKAMTEWETACKGWQEVSNKWKTNAEFWQAEYSKTNGKDTTKIEN